jgi:hypothetical protein
VLPRGLPGGVFVPARAGRSVRQSSELTASSAGQRLADPQAEALEQLRNALELEVMAVARAERGQLIRVRIDRATDVRELPEETLEAGGARANSRVTLPVCVSISKKPSTQNDPK